MDKVGIEVMVPDIGDFKDVAVIELLVKPGDTIAADQSLITVESDKASMEIPSSGAGVLKELKVKVGDTVNIGDLIAILEGSAGAAPAPAPSQAAAAAPAAATASAPAPAAASPAPAPAACPAAAAAPHDPTTAPSANLPHASPTVRKFARELGVPLEEVKGSGPKGRITQEDVQGFTKAVMSGQASTKARRQGAGRWRQRGRRGGWACCPGPRSTSPSSVRSSARTCRASRRSAARTCTATG
jgi:pyruvate dehydrogenase E2 component (dihydrolipoamide acetyltransferase)